jgi:hypothetical protein
MKHCRYTQSICRILLAILFISLCSVHQASAQRRNQEIRIGAVDSPTPMLYHLPSVTLSNDLIVEGPVIIVIDGDFDLKNNNMIILPGASAEIYLGGDMTISGNGEVNNANVPAALRIYGTADVSQNITLNGNSLLSGVIYAPKANVTFNGGGNKGALLGAIVAYNITFNGSPGPFHFDEALWDLDDRWSRFRLTSYNLVRGNAQRYKDLGELRDYALERKDP